MPTLQATTRNQDIITRAHNGEPRTQIAKDHGISTERVRQIVNHDATLRGTTPPARVRTPKTTTPAEHDHALSTIPALAEKHPNLPALNLAIEAGHNVTAAEVARILGNAETLRRQAHLRRELGRKYDTATCLDAIRYVAARLPPNEQVTMEAYNTHCAPNAPAVSTILSRFGSSWTKACTTAGVLSGDAPRGFYERRFTPADMITAAADFFRQHGAAATLSSYEQWATQEAGRPAASTIRRHFGSWGRVRLAAAEELGQDWA